MESANVFGSDEDCRSCESGWTMYLGSSHSHDHDHGYHYEDDDDEEDSDGGDSMDSDASSGPMEATSGLKSPQKIEEQNTIKKKMKNKISNEKIVMVETTRVNDDDDDDDDDDGDHHDYDDGNDSYSAVHSYVGSVSTRRISLK